jgi:hypothetical protein
LTREDENRKVDMTLQIKRLKEEHALHENQWKLRDSEQKKHADYLKEQLTTSENRTREIEKQLNDYREKVAKSSV